QGAENVSLELAQRGPGLRVELGVNGLPGEGQSLGDRLPELRRQRAQLFLRIAFADELRALDANDTGVVGERFLPGSDTAFRRGGHRRFGTFHLLGMEQIGARVSLRLESLDALLVRVLGLRLRVGYAADASADDARRTGAEDERPLLPQKGEGRFDVG